jgi:hypothetical protein
MQEAHVQVPQLKIHNLQYPPGFYYIQVCGTPASAWILSPPLLLPPFLRRFVLSHLQNTLALPAISVSAACMLLLWWQITDPAGKVCSVT